MEEAFPNSRKIHEKIDDILNFITSCLRIVPKHRPSIRQLQKHKFAGGAWKKEFSEIEVNIRNKRKEFPNLM